MAKYAGIDWSMSCPAICLYDSKKKMRFENCDFFFYHDNKKFDKSFANIHGFKQRLYTGNEERFNNLSEWAMEILQKAKVRNVCLEGYAMGAKGLVFNIAENGGLLKHKMWMAGIEFICPSPNTVKKHFTTKGNANKDAMHQALLDSEGVSVSDLFQLNLKPSDSPVSDVVDAYAMLKYLVENPDSKMI